MSLISGWRPRTAAPAALAVALIATLLPAAPRGAAADTVQVTVTGVDGPPEDNVNSVLAIRRLEKQKSVNPSEVRRLHGQAPQQIAAALEPFGYYRVETQSDLRHDGKVWKATYEVRPGPPIRLSQVSVEVTGEGAGEPRFRQLASGFPLATGSVLEHARYEQGKNALSETALELGYLDASFPVHELIVDRVQYAAQVRLQLDTGKRYYFGPVRFDQDILDPSFLRGYLTFHPGDPLDFGRLLVLQNSLNESPYFRVAEVRPVRDETVDQRVPIDVRLVPARRLRLDLGAGYGTDTGPQARATANWRRLNRRGHRAESELRVSTIEQSASGTYTLPWPYPRTDRLDFAAGWARHKTSTSLSRTWRFGSKYSLVRGLWQEMFSLFYQREFFKVGADSGTVKLLMPEISPTLIRADNRLDPRHGVRFLTSLRGARRSLLSDISVVQVLLGAKAIMGFAPRQRLIARADFGYTRVSDFLRLPASLRFFAGGSESVRGYAFNSLGPRDVTGHVTGGRYLEAASVEYEYRFMPSWGIATFYDTGNALQSLRGSLRSGAGVGLRWRSPVGLVRPDLAWPLNGDGRRRIHLHLSIGPEL